ncbi:MAG: argininosuccinate lyase [Patescibacteria group bacterium]
MKLWQKQYKLNKAVEKFTVGNDYILDRRLVKYDCLASIAHAKMLVKIGVLKPEEAKKLEARLKEIIALDSKGKFEILPEDEDCHTAIENYLTKKLGNTGKKIHTARSRNDQVLTALRLFYKDQLADCKKLAENFAGTLKNFTKKFGKIKLPGYTHSRKAMPSSIRMWTESFVDSMKDNIKSLAYAHGLIDQSPLGTAAGYGLPIEIDRRFTAKLLGFKSVQNNPIYTQNSRGKFESAILHALGQIMFDANKISSDLIIFSMPEFGYFDLPTEFCTGSSIMPQKKNPDVLELLRAKYFTVAAMEFQVRGTVGNLLSGYNRDVQLLKEPIFKALDITLESLEILNEVFKKLKVNAKRSAESLTDEIYATDEVYKLVLKGMAFREAYKIVGKKYG